MGKLVVQVATERGHDVAGWTCWKTLTRRR